MNAPYELLWSIDRPHPAGEFIHEDFIHQGILPGQDFRLEVVLLFLDLSELQVGVPGGLQVVLKSHFSNAFPYPFNEAPRPQGGASRARSGERNASQ